ncbi:MAG: hypothetical protein K2K12_03555, partial [Clostridia bacterium]|nr:hypothetical protein [Clostridia bacterium]
MSDSPYQPKEIRVGIQIGEYLCLFKKYFNQGHDEYHVETNDNDFQYRIFCYDPYKNSPNTIEVKYDNILLYTRLQGSSWEIMQIGNKSSLRHTLRYSHFSFTYSCLTESNEIFLNNFNAFHQNPHTSPRYIPDKSSTSYDAPADYGQEEDSEEVEDFVIIFNASIFKYNS